jgi:hypothetical protein
MGTKKEDDKKMRKQFSRLSKAEQQKVELEYHQMPPDQLEKVMVKGKRHSPGTIRLSSRLVEKLKTVAKCEGEPEYQTMVKRWVEERLQQETKSLRKPSKLAVPAKHDQV